MKCRARPGASLRLPAPIQTPSEADSRAIRYVYVLVLRRFRIARDRLVAISIVVGSTTARLRKQSSPPTSANGGLRLEAFAATREGRRGRFLCSPLWPEAHEAPDVCAPNPWGGDFARPPLDLGVSLGKAACAQLGEMGVPDRLFTNNRPGENAGDVEIPRRNPRRGDHSTRTARDPR